MNGLFRVSAKDHAAVILMTELAARYDDQGYLSLQDVAHSMGLSEGYLEEIASTLKAADLIQGKQGPGGGYRLAATPRKISIADVLTAIEGPLTLVDCQSKGGCPVEHRCSSKSVWNTLQKTIQASLQKTTLAELSQ